MIIQSESIAPQTAMPTTPAPTGRDSSAQGIALGSTPATNPRPEGAPLADDNFLKYVIVCDEMGREHPIIFPMSISHRDMVPKHMLPISAGFLVLYEKSLEIPAIGSDTLGLEPRIPRDKQLICSALTLSPSHP